ncbi:MAG: S9 family peptidase [Caedimonadaceae bacterium]|nr:MAG: S9 family peptidase [Caedimonadaceae bacterium]
MEVEMNFLKMFFAFLILVLPTDSSQASKVELAEENIQHQIVPRHLFLPIVQEAYEKQPSYLASQMIKKATQFEYVDIVWQYDEPETANKHVIFSAPLERPIQFYHLLPNKTFRPLAPKTKSSMRFERAITPDVIMWFTQDPTDPKSNQYHLYSILEGKELPFQHPTGFWKIVFDDSLYPLVAVKRESLNQKTFFVLDSNRELSMLCEKSHPLTVTSHAVFDEHSNTALYYDVGLTESDQETLKITTAILVLNQLHSTLMPIATNVCLDPEIPPLPVLSGTTSPFFAVPCHKNGKRDWIMPPGLRLIANKMFKALHKEVENKPYVLQHLGALDLDQYTFEIAFDREPERSGTFHLTNRTITWNDDPFPHFKELRLLHSYLAPMEHQDIKARDGFTIPTCLTLPKHLKGPFPTIILIHGGPYDHVAFRFSRICQILSNRGFATLSPNYRGSSYDTTTAFSGMGEWGRKMQTDIHDVIEWSIQKGLADPKRVGLWGGSYGGYAALLEATTPYKSSTFPGIACASAFSAPVDLSRFLEEVILELGEEDEVLKYLDTAFNTSPDKRNVVEINQTLQSLSPIHKSSGIQIPLMFGHGVYDSRVLVKHAQDFSSNLKGKNIPHIFYTFEAPHEISEPKDMTAEWAIQEHFFAKHLGVLPEPFGNVLRQSSIKVEEGIDLIPGLKEAGGR